MCDESRIVSIFVMIIAWFSGMKPQRKKYDELTEIIEQKEAYGEIILQFIKILREQDGIITEFDDALWGSMVEFVTIGKASRSVSFKDGTEITVE